MAVAVVLLVVGYVAAVPLVLRLPAIVRHRRVGRFVALESATALVAAGWAAFGAPLGVALNLAFLVGFAVLWRRTRSFAVVSQ